MRDQPNRREIMQTVCVMAAAGTAGGNGMRRRSGDLSIKVADYTFYRVQVLRDGRVSIEGCDHSFEAANIYNLNAVEMGGDKNWDVQRIGLHPRLRESHH